jgi:hypothetical protein
MNATRGWLVISTLCFSALTVYAQYAFIDTTDGVTHRTFREESLAHYHEILEGRRPFPFQWRVLAPWLVRFAERTTSLDPHLVDVTLKSLALAGSTLVLIEFAASWTSPMGALLTGACYVLWTAIAFASEGYSIYLSNDYLLMAGWFAAVSLLGRARFGWAASVIFLTAFAKETIGLAPILVAFMWWRGRATWREWVTCAVAFLLPALFLRAHYPAPLCYWAWWNNIERNVPFVRTEPTILALTLRNNIKVLMFFNVLAWLAGPAAARLQKGAFLRDVGLVSIVYLAVAYVVVYIRELRHFLPLAVALLPLAVAEIEHRIHPADLLGGATVDALGRAADVETAPPERRARRHRSLRRPS